MTGFDPYDVLGVGRSAEQAAIKSAYRKRVQTAHPDRGGDADEFVSIVRAFGLLSDPVSRRRFDETGIVDEAGIQDYRREVTVILVDLFDAAVQTAIATGLPLTSVNFIDHMSVAVRAGTIEAERQVRQLDEEIEALRALRARIRRNDSELNLFVERLNEQIRAKTEQHTTERRRVAMLETATVELSNYETEVELISALQSAS
ncbi:J domain-containing protein [Arsenicitalea aurantiaca]|uniref:J domain-containing protein n=1 Tax=Arsenicitalea aurantiaca TaxID=1783274 RepID=A0A433X7R4_9HYPH|nr:J domain-containing protein [Arsenicitalea aurantiaca]RUT30090.1 J domain-containing protein [Arsenicitalea aurantiaca]